MPKLENTLVVLPYDPNWKIEFERIRDYLMEQIGDLVLEIKHGGSTSVPGLCAKPIIDIFAMMESYDIFPEIVARLEKIGFVHEGDGGIKDREVFKRIIPDDFMNYHFYVCPKDSEENRRHTIFRNALLNDKNIADEYGKLKMRLIEEVNGDRVLYTNSKTDFILGVINNELIKNLDKLHTTKLGIGRIKQNLGIETDDVVEWCRQKIRHADDILRSGKNWYVHTDDSVITVNAQSYTIITAHKITASEIKTEGFTETDLEDAYEAFLSMIHKLEKTQEKIKPGTPQWTTLIRRLKSLRLAITLINKELKKESK